MAIATFTRPSVAYSRIDGSLVASGVARFEPGPWAGRLAWLGEEATQNFLKNASFEVYTGTTGLADGWVSYVAFGSYASSTDVVGGSRSQKCIPDGVALAPRLRSPLFAVTEGLTYIASVWAKAPAGYTVGIGLKYYNSTGGEVGGTNFITTTSTGAWQRLAVTAAVPTGISATQAVVTPGMTNTPPSTTYVIFDSCQCEQKPYATSIIFANDTTTQATRSPEPLAIPISAAVLPLTGFTWEQMTYFNSMARRQVSGQNPAVLRIPRASGGNGIGFYHNDTTAAFILESRNDAGAVTSVSVGDAYLPDGFHRVRLVVSTGPPAMVEVLIDGTVRGSIPTPNLPTALGTVAYIGSADGTSNFLNTLHADIRGSNIARPDTDDPGITAPLPVDQYTTAKLDLNGHFEIVSWPFVHPHPSMRDLGRRFPMTSIDERRFPMVGLGRRFPMVDIQ